MIISNSKLDSYKSDRTNAFRDSDNTLSPERVDRTIEYNGYHDVVVIPPNYRIPEYSKYIQIKRV